MDRTLQIHTWSTIIIYGQMNDDISVLKQLMNTDVVKLAWKTRILHLADSELQKATQIVIKCLDKTRYKDFDD